MQPKSTILSEGLLRSFATLFLAVCVVWLGGSSLKAQCPVNVPYEDQAQTLNSGFLAPSDTVWQSFVSDTTDSLQSIWVKFSDSQTPVRDTLRIFKGEGIGGMELFKMGITIDRGLQPFILDTAIYLDKDTLYTFMLSSDPDSGLFEPAIGCGFVAGPDIYPPGTSSFWEPVNKCELFFRTIMGGNDTLAPIMTCKTDTLVLDLTGNATALLSNLTTTTFDECTIDSILVSQSTFDCADTGVVNLIDLIIFDRTGRSDSCTSNIHVEDRDPPSITCSPFNTFLDSTGMVLITPSDLVGPGTDNCSPRGLFLNDSIITCGGVVITDVITVYAFDLSGNIDSCTSNIIVQDSIGPIALCMDTVVVYFDSLGALDIDPLALDNGSSDNCGVTEYIADGFDFTCADTGVQAVQLIVSDQGLLQDSCSLIVILADTVSPNAECKDETLLLDSLGNASLSVGIVDNGSSDNCIIDSSWVTPSTFDCSDLGTVTVSLALVDISGNIDSCFANVEIAKNPPSVTCKDTTLGLDSLGILVFIQANVVDELFDNCGVDTLIFTPDSIACADTGIVSVQVTAIGIAGQVDSCTTNLFIVDNLAPIALCSTPTVYLNAAGIATISVVDIDSTSSDNCGLDTLYLSRDTLDCADLGGTTVTLFVQDISGNLSTCISSITVLDTLPVNTLCKNDSIYLDNAGFAPLTLDNLDGGSNDNCGIDSFSIGRTGFGCLETGVDTVSLTVFYVNGIIDSCQSLITVLDTFPDTAVCQLLTIYIDSAGSPLLLSPLQVFAPGGPSCRIDSMFLSDSVFTCADTGSVSISLTAIDYLGDTTSCTTTITTLDTISPFMVCAPLDVVLDSLGQGGLIGDDLDGGSTDNCGIDTLIASQDSFTVFFLGTNSITLYGVDVNGNIDSCISIVSVLDTLTGDAECGDVTVLLDSMGTVTLDPTDVFIGGIPPFNIDTMTLSPSSFGCSPPDVKIATLVVNLLNTSISSCTTNVTVVDTILPEMACNDLSIDLNSSGTYLVDINDLDGGINDNCGIASLFASQLLFDCTDTGSVIVTLSALDVKGNIDSCFSTITVMDTTPPDPLCASTTLFLDTIGETILLPSVLDGGSSDNCGIETLTISQDTFDCAEIGDHLVTLILTDGSGNTSSCLALITVEDTLTPVLLCADTTIQLDSSGMHALIPADIDVGSTDNCFIDSLELSQSLFGCADLGTVLVQLYAVDSSGNLDSCSANVTVEDTFALSITCPPDQSHTNDLVFCGNSPIPLPTLGPGCFAGATFVNSFNGGPDATDVYPMGITVVDYIVDDGFGDSATCSFTVTIENSLGTAPPAISPPGPYPLCSGDTLTLDAGGSYFGYEWNTGDTSRFLSTSTAGMFFCRVFNGFGPNCWRYTDTADVFVAPLPTIPSITAVLDSLISSPAVTYQWNLDGSPISGADNQAYIPMATGDYSVTTEDSNGCQATSAPLGVTVNRAEELNNQITLYPNPTTGQVFVRSQHRMANRVEVQVFTPLGRRVKSIAWNSLELNQRLDLNEVAAGVYFVHLIVGSHTMTRKLIVSD